MGFEPGFTSGSVRRLNPGIRGAGLHLFQLLGDQFMLVLACLTSSAADSMQMKALKYQSFQRSQKRKRTKWLQWKKDISFIKFSYHPPEKMVVLNPNIGLAPSLASTLNPEVIDIVNEVACSVELCFPGLIVQLGKKMDIHRALSLEGSPIPQGDDEHDSTHAFQCWLISTAGVVPSRVVPGVATTSWKQLDSQQADDILWRSWHRVAWNVTMKKISPPLHIAKVFKATTEGEGKIQIYELPVF